MILFSRSMRVVGDPSKLCGTALRRVVHIPLRREMWQPHKRTMCDVNPQGGGHVQCGPFL